MRTHFSWEKKPTTPELITLSDDDDDIQCITEVKTDSLRNTAKKKMVDDCISVFPMDDSTANTIPLPPHCKRIRLPPDSLPHTRPSELKAPMPPKFVNDSLPSVLSRCTTPNDKLTLPNNSFETQLNAFSTNRISQGCVHQKNNIVSPMDENCLLESSVVGKKDINLTDMKLEDGFPNASNSSVEIQSKGRFQSSVIERLDEVDSDYWPLERIRLNDITNHTMDFSDDVLATRKKLENLRQWRSTGFSNDLQRNSRLGDAVFTLMSYNVLAQKLLTGNMYLYTGCESEHLDWQYRWTLLQHEIKHINADILTFQEVQSNHYHEYFLPWFTHLGYQGSYKKRTGDKFDGCAIFFRSSKFELVESTSVEFYQPNTFLDRDNVGLICSLVCKHNNAPICVATTHLLYNPKRHDIKLAQLQLFLAEIERIAYSGHPYRHDASPYIPLIITGDMNAYPYQSVINFLKQRSIYYFGLDSKSLTPLNTGGRTLSGFLLPRQLGVTDTCQHAGVLALRATQAHGQRVSLLDQRARELRLIGLHHSERQPTPVNVSGCLNEHFTGHLQHPFHLKSVFKHSLDRLGGVPEITAQVNDWQTVDYILYSQVYSYRDQRAVEGSLKLMARYDLLSGPEARQFGPLPSAVSPSDHFPLAAQFLLRGTAN
ncbi:Endonuclease/exonuclease/phosphatase [Trinorchestia longiramus]|nr:Endonuclease/exonuclease/phosphatase [Trinorchestia longiramus]